MQGSDFIYFIKSDDTHFYAMDNDILVNSTQPRPLIFSPDGWQEISIQNQRNKKYKGIDRTLTIPYNFVEDGAGILKSIVYKYGTEAPANLVICQQQLYIDSTTYGFWYKVILNAEIDLSTFNHSGTKVTCTMIEGGLPKFLKANENTTYEIPLDENPIPVLDDGIEIAETLNFEIQDQFVTPDYSYLYMPLTFLNNEGTSSGVTYYSVVGENQTHPDYSSARYFLHTDNALAAHFVIKIKFSVQFAGITSKFYLQTQTRQYLLKDNTVFPEGNVYEFDFDFTWNLLAGENVYFMSDAPSSANPLTTVTFLQSDFKVSYLTRHTATTVNGRTLLDCFKYLVDKISEGTLQAESTLLSGLDVVLTSGDGLRSLPGSKAKTSFSDFFQFMDTWQDVGITMRNGKVILEKALDLFDYTTITSLGEVANPIVTIANDFPFNVLKIGFPDKQQEEVNGKESFINTFEWSLGTTRNPKTLDKTCKYVPDPYSQELTRITFTAANTTDSRQDNDIYPLHIKNNSFTSPVEPLSSTGTNTLILGAGLASSLRPGIRLTISGSSIDGTYTIVNVSGVNVVVKEPVGLQSLIDASISVTSYILNRDLNAGTTGLKQPGSTYNIIFSPKRCLLNNGAYLRSCLYKQETKTLKFQTAPKNSSVVSNGIIEKEDVNVGSLDLPYFKPIFVSVETQGDLNILDELDANPLRVFDFDFKGNNYVMIAELLGIEPSSRQTQVYRFLCGKDTNILPLINYYGE